MKPYVIIFTTKSNTSHSNYRHAMLQRFLVHCFPHRLRAYKHYTKTASILSHTIFQFGEDLHFTTERWSKVRNMPCCKARCKLPCFHIRPVTSGVTCCALATVWLDIHVLLMSFPYCSLGKNSQFPLEVLNCCYKAVIKSLQCAFCLYLQMVSHAIKIFSLSKKKKKNRW